MITFKEFLLEADAKSKETKEYLAKQRDKSKRVKLKHTDKRNIDDGTPEKDLPTSGTPSMLRKQAW